MKEQSINPEVLQELGKNIKRIRLLRGLSQEGLAEKLEKSINFISLLENGKTGLTVQTIIDICNVLGVDANELFTGLVPASDKNENSAIVNSLNLFNDTDKAIVTDLIDYIVNSKN